MSFEETRKKVELFVNKYALKSGYKLNQDKKSLDLIINGLSKQKEKYGFQYCPCRIITFNKEFDKNLICPCKQHIKDIENNGMCHCYLFYK